MKFSYNSRKKEYFERITKDYWDYGDNSNDINNSRIPIEEIKEIKQQRDIQLPDTLWRKILNYSTDVILLGQKHSSVLNQHQFMPIESQEGGSLSQPLYMGRERPGTREKNVVANSDIPALSRVILRYGRVCKRWSNGVVPFIDYGTIAITTVSEMEYVYRLMSVGIHKGTKIRLESLYFKFYSTMVDEQDIASSSSLMTLVEALPAHIDQLHTLVVSGYTSDTNIVAQKIDVFLALFIEACKVQRLVILNRPYDRSMELVKLPIVQTVESVEILHTRCPHLTVFSTGNTHRHDISGTMTKWLKNTSRVNSMVVGITQLHLNNLRMTDEEAGALADAVGASKTLQTFVLASSMLTDRLGLFARALINNQTLNKLALPGNAIQDVDCLVELVTLNHTIVHLCLSHNNIQAPSINNFLEACATSGHLVSLSLQQCKTINMVILGELVHKSRSLLRLNLHSVPIGDNDVLLPSIVGSSIVDLNLSYLPLDPSQELLLAHLVAESHTLKRLDLSWVGNLSTILPSLASNSSITHLDLSLNHIGPTDAAAIALALANPSSSINHLNLAGNILMYGAHQIFEALQTNTSLTYLNLLGNFTNNFPKGLLFKVLARSPQSRLSTLILGRNKLNISDGLEIASALAYNSTLTRLDLSSNQLDGTVGLVVFETLQFNRSILHLTLDSNSFGRNVALLLRDRYQTRFPSLDSYFNDITKIDTPHMPPNPHLYTISFPFSSLYFLYLHLKSAINSIYLEYQF